jgi:hypothetical protein
MRKMRLQISLLPPRQQEQEVAISDDERIAVSARYAAPFACCYILGWALVLAMIMANDAKSLTIGLERSRTSRESHRCSGIGVDLLHCALRHRGNNSSLGFSQRYFEMTYHPPDIYFGMSQKKLRELHGEYERLQ